MSLSVPLVEGRYVLDWHDGSDFSLAVVTLSGGNISLTHRWFASHDCDVAAEARVVSCASADAATESDSFVRKCGVSYCCESGWYGL